MIKTKQNQSPMKTCVVRISSVTEWFMLKDINVWSVELNISPRTWYLMIFVTCDTIKPNEANGIRWNAQMLQRKECYWNRDSRLKMFNVCLSNWMIKTGTMKNVDRIYYWLKNHKISISIIVPLLNWRTWKR